MTVVGTPTRRLRLVVVDDDADVRKALSRLLSSAGYSVTSFDSAEAYLARERDDDPDCLLLDIGLGGMSGFELREELLAHRGRGAHRIHHRAGRRSDPPSAAPARLGALPAQAVQQSIPAVGHRACHPDG